MGYSWFLKLALTCIDHFAWPLLALGYPLCASVQAIETDSYSETRDLISYWILLSLICLFEYAFMRLLSWFQFWPYIKLMIIFWLIIPDFGRASSVYNNLIRSCISTKPQVVIRKLKNWRKLFAKKENFLLHAERYIQENGTEALEKLLASKITTHNPDAEATNTIRATDKKEMQQTNWTTTHNPDAKATNTIRTTDKKEKQQTNGITAQNPDAEATNAIRATDKKEKQQTNVITTHNPDAEATNTIRATDKKEMQQTNEKKFQTEHKDIKDLEVIEKKEISAGKQDIPVMPDLFLSQNVSSARMETNGTATKDAASGELPQSYTRKEVQKEWTCAVCQVTTTCERNLNMHLHGRKHKAACEALNAKNQPSPQKLKNDQSKEDLKQKNAINELAKNVQIFRAKEHAQTSSMLNDPVIWRNVIGQESNSTRDQKGVMMNYPILRFEGCDENNSKNGERISNNGLKGKVVIDHEKVQGLQQNLGKPVMMNKSKSRCEACNVTCTSEADMASHMKEKCCLYSYCLDLRTDSFPSTIGWEVDPTWSGSHISFDTGWE